MTGWLVAGVVVLMAIPLAIIVRKQLQKAGAKIDTAIKEELPPPTTWSTEQASTMLALLDSWTQRGIPEQQQVEWLRPMYIKGELPPGLEYQDITPAAVRRYTEDILQECA